MEPITLNTSFSVDLLDNFSPGGTVGDPDSNYYWTPTWYNPLVRTYYPVYLGYYNFNGDKHQKAFAVAKLLIEKEIIDIKKVKDFIELVESIFKIIQNVN